MGVVAHVWKKVTAIKVETREAQEKRKKDLWGEDEGQKHGYDLPSVPWCVSYKHHLCWKRASESSVLLNVFPNLACSSFFLFLLLNNESPLPDFNARLHEREKEFTYMIFVYMDLHVCFREGVCLWECGNHTGLHNPDLAGCIPNFNCSSLSFVLGIFNLKG